MRPVALLLLAVLFLAVGCSTSKELTLRLNPKEKDQFMYLASSDQFINTETMGMKQEQTQAQAIEYRYDILKVLPDGSSDVKVTIESVKIDNVSPLEEVHFDSKSGDPADGQTAKVYASMIGQVFRMKMDSTGAVTEVSGGDEMIDNMFEVIDIPGGEEMLKTMKGAMKMQFGDQSLKESLGTLTDYYPGKPIKVGDSWEKIQLRTTNIGLKVKNTYTLTSRSEGKAYIDIVSTMEPLPDAKPLDLGMMQIKYLLGGTQTGQLIVDEATGWAISSNINQKLAGDMEISGPELPFGTLNGKMDADSKIVYKRID